jgi:hypothetical protein
MGVIGESVWAGMFAEMLAEVLADLDEALVVH